MCNCADFHTDPDSSDADGNSKDRRSTGSKDSSSFKQSDSKGKRLRTESDAKTVLSDRSGSDSDNGEQSGGEEQKEASDEEMPACAQADVEFGAGEAILEQKSSRVAEFVVNQFLSWAGRKKKFSIA